MHTQHTKLNSTRARWAAVGAAIAVSVGAGGVGLIQATSPDGASTFMPIEPCRMLDTRPDFNVGPRNTPIGTDETYSLTATGTQGECDIPADATGVVLNVTAVDATAPTYLTLWPSGTDRPNASALNPAPGTAPTPNAVTTDLNADGNFSIYNRFGTVDVIADAVGYYVDHNHDDRYYTRTEIDEQYAQVEALAAQVDEQYAEVQAFAAQVLQGFVDFDAELEQAVHSQSGKLVYAWIDEDGASAPIDTPTVTSFLTGYSFNTGSDPATVTRTAVGMYEVVFPGANLTGGNVQVSAYGDTARSCQVRYWATDTIYVNCYDLAGNPVNSTFSAMFVN